MALRQELRNEAGVEVAGDVLWMLYKSSEERNVRCNASDLELVKCHLQFLDRWLALNLQFSVCLCHGSALTGHLVCRRAAIMQLNFWIGHRWFSSGHRVSGMVWHSSWMHGVTCAACSFLTAG